MPFGNEKSKVSKGGFAAYIAKKGKGSGQSGNDESGDDSFGAEPGEGKKGKGAFAKCPKCGAPCPKCSNE